MQMVENYEGDGDCSKAIQRGEMALLQALRKSCWKLVALLQEVGLRPCLVLKAPLRARSLNRTQAILSRPKSDERNPLRELMRNLEVAVLAPRAAEMRQYCANVFPKDDVRDGSGGGSSYYPKDKKIPLAISIWPKSKIGSEFTIN
jgi:hypothetical protein